MSITIPAKTPSCRREELFDAEELRVMIRKLVDGPMEHDTFDQVRRVMCGEAFRGAAHEITQERADL